MSRAVIARSALKFSLAKNSNSADGMRVFEFYQNPLKTGQQKLEDGGKVGGERTTCTVS